MSWLLGQEAGGVLVPRPGIQPVSPALDGPFSYPESLNQILLNVVA